MRRHLPPDEQDLSDVFEQYLGLAEDDDDFATSFEYGVHAVLLDRTITLVLTFLEDRDYCCSDPDCHLPFDQGGEWEALREICENEGAFLERPLILRCQTAIRPSARFDESCGHTGAHHEPQRAEFREDRV